MAVASFLFSFSEFFLFKFHVGAISSSICYADFSCSLKREIEIGDIHINGT